MLDTVELDHGKYSHDPPFLFFLEALGVGMTDAIREALAALGFTEIVVAADSSHVDGGRSPGQSRTAAGR